MKTSDQGLDLIKEREACKLEAYPDPGTGGEPWTIGVGHTGGVKPGDRITEAEAMDLLRKDLEWCEAAVNLVKVPLEQHQFDALVSFVFNVGQGAFAASTMLRLLNAGKYAEVPAQFDRWHIPAMVTSRRNGEREQFKGTQFAARID